MPLIFQKMIRREDLRNNPDWIYVFGDNFKRVGLGGQAGEMRGEPNAIGIATKHAPGMQDSDFFHDDQFVNESAIRAELSVKFGAIASAISQGKTVVFPADGIGTGLSQLPTRAPAIDAAIKTMVYVLSRL